jgi:hypothetical protein
MLLPRFVMLLEAFLKTIFDTYISILIAFAATFLVLANHCSFTTLLIVEKEKVGQ